MTSQPLGVPAARSRSWSKLRCFARTSGVAVAMLLPTPALFAADRLSDDDVKAVLERIDWERDRFEDQLDGRLKRSILRDPGMEVNVERFLDDLQENLDTLKERFTAEYAASAEVTGLLNQASAIQHFMSAQPPDIDGASEWNRLAESLTVLAAVYGTVMPIPVGQQARRMNDREVEQLADNLAQKRRSVQEGSGLIVEDTRDDRQGDPRRRHHGRGRTKEGCGKAGVGRRRPEAGVRRGQGVAQSCGQAARGVGGVRAVAERPELVARGGERSRSDLAGIRPARCTLSGRPAIACGLTITDVQRARSRPVRYHLPYDRRDKCSAEAAAGGASTRRSRS